MRQRPYALQRDLVARDLCVMLDAVPRTNVSPASGMFNDASDATCCVLFSPINEGDHTEIAFIALSAPSKGGALPRFVAHAAAGESNAVEVGRLSGDVGGLATRVAERVQMLKASGR